ncbi:hypothetical protein [Lentilactobacillus kosonis]|uniref:Uncharacterized protein n=1 Tax=Lentilactobacillus kosonis TaxID=2810561 RepID=A0A401FPJ8_9LACO|nr:hypothetical protein [Lentilactobacillus kosonis]GAY74236.1 hypothetical protein NBRC111893_2382 [Lentilactobacillus kosonis]
MSKIKSIIKHLLERQLAKWTKRAARLVRVSDSLEAKGEELKRKADEMKGDK